MIPPSKASHTLLMQPLPVSGEDLQRKSRISLGSIMNSVKTFPEYFRKCQYFRCQKSWGRIWGYRAKNSAKRVNYESSRRRRRWGCRTKRVKCNQVPSTSGEVSAVQSKSRTGPNEADGKVLRRSMWKAKQRWRKEDYNLWFPIHRIFTQHSLHS